MLNRVILIGRLTRDPELRYTPQSTPVAQFTIAIDRPFSAQQANEKPETDFIPIVVWRKQAESVKKCIHSGSLVGVEGRIQVRNYEDKDGIRRYVTEVVADRVMFLEPKGTKDALNQFESNDFSNAQNSFVLNNQEPQNNNQDDDDDKYENVSFTSNDLPF